MVNLKSLSGSPPLRSRSASIDSKRSSLLVELEKGRPLFSEQPRRWSRPPRLRDGLVLFTVVGIVGFLSLLHWRSGIVTTPAVASLLSPPERPSAYDGKLESVLGGDESTRTGSSLDMSAGETAAERPLATSTDSAAGSSGGSADDMETAKRIREFNTRLKEVYPAAAHGVRAYRTFTFDQLEALASCLEAGSCKPNQREIILLGSYHFGYMLEGMRGGEHIWAMSTHRAFEQMGYSMVLGFGHMEVLYIYQGLADMVKIVIWNDTQLKACIERNATNFLELEKGFNEDPGDWQVGQKACIANEDYPTGVPMWKSFAFFFFFSPQTPLGARWTLAPFDLPDKDNFYLGFSIEHTCMKIPIPKVREHRAFVLAKRTRYFLEKWNAFFGLLKPTIDNVPAVETPNGLQNFTLMSTASNPPGDDGPDTVPGIDTIGQKPQAEWQALVAGSKVMLGLGWPRISPSPLDALCMGVPFINPIQQWDRKNPEDRSKWFTQQDSLKYLNPPYVYQVQKGDQEGLESALNKAINNPVERYIPENMKWDYVFKRHEELLSNDWRAECNKYVDEHHGEEGRWMCKWGETK